MHQLVLADLADVQAELSDTLVDIIIPRHCTIIPQSDLLKLARVRRNLGLALYGE